MSSSSFRVAVFRIKLALVCNRKKCSYVYTCVYVYAESNPFFHKNERNIFVRILRFLLSFWWIDQKNVTPNWILASSFLIEFF